jgi:thiosulfate/3-mercaptopyruvate sulfurtransferase
MKRLVGWMAAALLAGAVLQGNARAVQPLLTPAELKDLQGGAGVRIIDIRSPKAYDDRHIPGAVSAPYGTWRGPAGNPGELPDLPRLTGLVQRLGLTPEVHAVVVSSGDDASDFGAAARVVWTLKALGLKQLSVLNGGVQAWVAAGMALDPMPEVVQASTYTPVLDRSLVATREELLSQTAGSVRLLDARPAAFFRGETRHQAALVPGTLKGAVNLEYTRWFAPDSSAMLPADEIKRLAAESSAAGDAPVVSFCNTGHWAAINWFALSEVAGQQGVKMYPGSLVDWSQSPGAAQAMDNVPGRAGQLWVDFKLWWARTFD